MLILSSSPCEGQLFLIICRKLFWYVLSLFKSIFNYDQSQFIGHCSMSSHARNLPFFSVSELFADMPSQQIQEIIILIGLQKITSNYVIRTILIITYLFVLFMKKKRNIYLLSPSMYYIFKNSVGRSIALTQPNQTITWKKNNAKNLDDFFVVSLLFLDTEYRASPYLRLHRKNFGTFQALKLN